MHRASGRREPCSEHKRSPQRAHPQCHRHSWPSVPSSATGMEADLAPPSTYQAASTGGRDLSVLLAQPGCPDATQMAFLAALCDKPQGHFCCPGRILATVGRAGWVAVLALGDLHCPTPRRVSAAWPPEHSCTPCSSLTLLRRLFPTVRFSPGAGQVSVPSGHPRSEGHVALGAVMAAEGWGDADARSGYAAPCPSRAPLGPCLSPHPHGTKAASPSWERPIGKSCRDLGTGMPGRHSSFRAEAHRLWDTVLTTPNLSPEPSCSGIGLGDVIQGMLQ